jgi:hypothetical protein
MLLALAMRKASKSCPFNHPLDKDRCERKADTGPEAVGHEPAGRGERLALSLPTRAYMRIKGAAEGAIMPTIITAHVANTNANSIGLHGAFAGAMIPMPAGIMRKPFNSGRYPLRPDSIANAGTLGGPRRTKNSETARLI